MSETRDSPWMCGTCGYVMDTCSLSAGARGVPRDGDISLCLNCCAVHTRHGLKWVPITPSEWQAFTSEELAEIAAMTQARSQLITGDLAARDRRGRVQ
jgi:hypothetical protein